MESSDPSLRVVLADDHHFFREGLRDLLEEAGLSVVGEAKDGAEALLLAEELKPDLVVIDLNMSGAPGSEALQRIADVSPEARTVVLTSSVEATEVLAALQAGASAYVVKGAQADELIAGIRQTASSHVVLSRAVIEALVIHVGPPDSDSAQAEAEQDRRAPDDARAGRASPDCRGRRQRRDRFGAVDQPAHRQAARHQHLREARRAHTRGGRRVCGACRLGLGRGERLDRADRGVAIGDAELGHAGGDVTTDGDR